MHSLRNVKRNCIRILQRKSVVTTYKWLNTTNSQLNKLKTTVKNNKGTTLKKNAKRFNGNNLPHELLLTTRQTTKLRNEIENNL